MKLEKKPKRKSAKIKINFLKIETDLRKKLMNLKKELKI